MTRSPQILTLTCADRVGVVAAVSGVLADRDGFILESQQFADLESGRFFMRMAFRPAETLESSADALRPIAERFGMDWQLHDSGRPIRVMIAVSRFGHCLNDLLHRWRTGTLPVEIVGVVSNHDDFRSLCDWHGIPYHHLPVTSDSRPSQEARILELMDELDAEMMVLARYMQVLSPTMCEALSGRCVNIHHSFLPSFRGAKPYHQAHARGVKLIGATAHYVTSDLDEGPIIEQAIERVDHAVTADAMVTVGRDVECIVLARAVTWAAERRILLNGDRTVVFRR